MRPILEHRFLATTTKSVPLVPFADWTLCDASVPVYDGLTGMHDAVNRVCHSFFPQSQHWQPGLCLFLSGRQAAGFMGSGSDCSRVYSGRHD